LYETVQDPSRRDLLRDHLTAGDVDYITFTSSSTVTNTLSLLGEDAKELMANVRVVCIGPITAATCVENGLTPDVIGETFTIPAMVDMIVADATAGV
uniref:uroporphyrinogen-III synthase n=1 Tax=Veillonella magna TaxID=464322 RepID=UPI00402B03B5